MTNEKTGNKTREDKDHAREHRCKDENLLKERQQQEVNMAGAGNYKAGIVQNKSQNSRVNNARATKSNDEVRCKGVDN